jgi:hypothetical protein
MLTIVVCLLLRQTENCIIIYFSCFSYTAVLCRMRDHQSSSTLAGSDATPASTATATAMRGADPKEMKEDPQTPSEAFKQGVHKFPSGTFGKLSE